MPWYWESSSLPWSYSFLASPFPLGDLVVFCFALGKCCCSLFASILKLHRRTQEYSAVYVVGSILRWPQHPSSLVHMPRAAPDGPVPPTMRLPYGTVDAMIRRWSWGESDPILHLKGTELFLKKEIWNMRGTWGDFLLLPLRIRWPYG